MIIFLAPPLGLYQPHLIHTLSIEISTKVSSISQNQTKLSQTQFMALSTGQSADVALIVNDKLQV
jgi:Ser-tRNA(Ala) deacylase AlaX